MIENIDFGDFNMLEAIYVANLNQFLIALRTFVRFFA